MSDVAYCDKRPFHDMQITLDKLLLEQANSRYEMQGEYVLPGLRDRTVIEKGKEERMWEKAMAGHLGNMITSMGRWRLRLDVPKAEVSDMLPVARLLSRSSDPAVVSRSKVTSNFRRSSPCSWIFGFALIYVCTCVPQLSEFLVTIVSLFLQYIPFISCFYKRTFCQRVASSHISLLSTTKNTSFVAFDSSF